MQKTFGHLKSLQCKRLLKDEQGRLIPTSEQSFTILYNESRISFDELRQLMQNDEYKTSNKVLVVNEDIAYHLSDETSELKQI